MKPLVGRWPVVLALVCSILPELATCYPPEFELQPIKVLDRGRAPALSSSLSSLQAAIATSQDGLSRECLPGQYSASRRPIFNDRRIRFATDFGSKEAWMIASRTGNFRPEPNARNPGNTADGALTEMAGSGTSRVLMQQSASPSCPLDFQFVRNYPFYSQSCQDFNPLDQNQTCCLSLVSALGQAESEYLKTSGQFLLKDEATVSACVGSLGEEIYSLDNSLSNTIGIMSTCFPAADYSAYVSNTTNCQGIQTRADFERIVDMTTIDELLNPACEGSLGDLHSCGVCVTAMYSVIQKLSPISPNNSHCLFYTLFYAAGISNSAGPLDQDTAECILAVGIGNTTTSKRGNLALHIGIGVAPAVLAFLILMFIIGVLYRRNARLTALAKKYDIQESALVRGPQNFKYRVLSSATKGFNNSSLLGSGGFGSVHRGTLVLKGDKDPTEIAVKRVSATSHQGAQEFLAEVKIIGQVQHRNLVRLLGWSHERGELLLVYQYMPNGSVDQHLYKNTPGEPVLTWSRRLKIVSGVATALDYLHEEWEQRVIHRDVKSSNVMLDSDFNARLGDFGLARLSEHDQAPPSTAVVAGTYGYLAPELVQTLKPTEKTDVYSFGALVLEVGTGKKPLLSKANRESFNKVFLVDWVWDLYRDDALLDAADCVLHNAYDPGEMIMFLKIGLLCSHPNPDERPTMREVRNIWKGSSPFPPLPRSKPISVFPLSPYSLGLDTDQYGETTLSFFTASYGHGDLSGAPTVALGADGDSTLTTAPKDDGGDTLRRENHYGQKGDSLDPTLLPRSASTALPF